MLSLSLNTYTAVMEKYCAGSEGQSLLRKGFWFEHWRDSPGFFRENWKGFFTVTYKTLPANRFISHRFAYLLASLADDGSGLTIARVANKSINTPQKMKK
jgi:hypothetical protein